MDIRFDKNGLHLHIHVTEAGDVLLLNLSPVIYVPADSPHRCRLVEIQESGLNQDDHHGGKHTGTQPGYLLKYRTHDFTVNSNGDQLCVEQEWDGLTVKSYIQFYDDIPVVRCRTALENTGRSVHSIEYVSSFALTGLSRDFLPRDENALINIPHNTWYGEAQWRAYTPHELGYFAVNDFSMKRISLQSTGSWPSSEYLPMGGYTNTLADTSLVWQIETSASWSWEISDIGSQLYLQISGPGYTENGFLKKLRPGERFVSEPCAIAVVKGGFEEGIRQLTRYRRAIRRINKDNENPSVIFNDYMNCLMGDPTAEKEYPLIDKAAQAGCKYYCIDCGWYDDGPWWDGVGQWLPSEMRFPGGIEKLLEYIREKGMIPGLWLEIEVVGINCPLVGRVPDNWFLQRNGKPIIDHSRYFLDFRNPEVREYADSVVDRLILQYGVGYIKNDYNVDAGVGTDLNSDSAGEGLLAHSRAFRGWLDAIFQRYPDLVIENCGSGGMRMVYSLLSGLSIQSVTDQTDYLKMAAIACNCMTACTPEQAAVWSYPLRGDDAEAAAFNMVNAMLFRIHQSGCLSELSAECFDLVREGIGYHKSIVRQLKDGLPFWPVGLATMDDGFLAAGIDCGREAHLAVWCVRECDISIPLGKYTSAECVYPKGLPTKYVVNERVLSADMAPKTARLFKLK